MFQRVLVCLLLVAIAHSVQADTICQQRSSAEANRCQGAIGCFITQCNTDGSFTQPQVWGSTGYTWCVDSQGNKLDWSERAPGQGRVNCALSRCQNQHESETTKCARKVGCFVTKCNEDGSYKAVQCSGSTGYCWCIDTEGNKHNGTDVRGQPNCESQSQVRLGAVKGPGNGGTALLTIWLSHSIATTVICWKYLP